MHLTARAVLLGLTALGAGLVFTAGASAADPGKIVIQVDKPGAKISPTFYGLMTKEINHSYDGGLYGELIQNRIFKNSARGNGPVPHWSVVHSEGAQETFLWTAPIRSTGWHSRPASGSISAPCPPASAWAWPTTGSGGFPCGPTARTRLRSTPRVPTVSAGL